MLQKCHVFLLIMDSPGGYSRATAPWLSFLETSHRADVNWHVTSNWHVMLRGTVFKIFAVKWQKLVSERPKWSTWSPFLTPHLETPKDVATKMGEDISGMQFYHRAKFHANWPHRCRDICPQTDPYLHTYEELQQI